MINAAQASKKYGIALADAEHFVATGEQAVEASEAATLRYARGSYGGSMPLDSEAVRGFLMCLIRADVPREQFGAASIAFSPSVGEDLRSKIRARFYTLVPSKRARAMSTNYTAARRGAEARGARALALPDSEPGKARAITRVYYRSMGGEILCFEALLPHKAAQDLKSECWGMTRSVDNPVYFGMSQKARDAALKTGTCPARYLNEPLASVTSPSDALGAQTWKFPGDVAPPILYGARLVRLPSQLVSGTAIAQHDEDADDDAAQQAAA